MVYSNTFVPFAIIFVRSSLYSKMSMCKDDEHEEKLPVWEGAAD